MVSIEVAEVVKTELEAEKLQGRNIEVPKPGSRNDSDAILIVGWVLGRTSPAVAVEIVYDSTVLQSAPVNIQRPDVADAFPEVPGAKQSGFRTTVAVPDTGESELLVQAALQNGSRAPLGVVRVWHNRSGEERSNESNVQDQPGLVTRFFRRVLGRGGG